MNNQKAQFNLLKSKWNFLRCEIEKVEIGEIVLCQPVMVIFNGLHYKKIPISLVCTTYDEADSWVQMWDMNIKSSGTQDLKNSLSDYVNFKVVKHLSQNVCQEYSKIFNEMTSDMARMTTVESEKASVSIDDVNLCRDGALFRDSVLQRFLSQLSENSFAEMCYLIDRKRKGAKLLLADENADFSDVESEISDDDMSCLTTMINCGFVEKTLARLLERRL